MFYIKTNSHISIIQENPTPDEVGFNEKLYEENMSAEFPENDMNDKDFRDKVIKIYIKYFDKKTFFRTKNLQ